MGGKDATSREHALPPGIAAQLAAEGGRVPFARFMELALTHPDDGYYARVDRLLGHRGDFTTVPRRSPVFNRAVARLLTDLVDVALSENSTEDRLTEDRLAEDRLPVIELGAGEGDLASAILSEWDAKRPDLMDAVAYSVVEIGEELKRKQASVLRWLTGRGWRVHWRPRVATPAVRTALGAKAQSAIVFGNEFVDALPVHLVDVRGPVALEAWVRVAEAPESVTILAGNDPGRGSKKRYQAVEEWGELSAPAAEELRTLFGSVDVAALRPHTRDGIIELRPATKGLLVDVASVAREVCLVTVDYGDWFAGMHDAGACGVACGLPPAPRRRSVRGYFKHQLASDPYERVGRQDLTADVDFAALDTHGRELGFETVLFATVAGFLAAARGGEELERLRGEAAGSLDADREAAMLAALLDPEDVGGVFKVMLQVRE